jgi:hypothetical protein
MSAMSEIPLPHSAKSVVPWWLLRHETMLAVILLIALVVLGGLNSRFLTLDNLLNQRSMRSVTTRPPRAFPACPSIASN